MIINRTTPTCQQIFFEGDSLFAHKALSANPVTADLNGHYIPSSVYASLISDNTLAYHSRAVSGRTMAQILAAVATNITPYVRTNDIVVILAGTNDLGNSGRNASDTYDDLVEYCETVRALGCKVIVCTLPARDFSTDTETIKGYVAEYNLSIRTNYTDFADALCDIGNDTLFDAVADASNTTYYVPDKLHLKTAGSDALVTLITTAVTSIL